ncbi:MAG TPA: glycosyltransferase family 4 protein [Gaiellaceae bacterium]|nr:glycosyltransferase family 4 protein [Gaiellaceae bacterium]
MTRSVVIVPGGIGGTGGLSIDVANLAAALAERSWDVTLAAPDASDAAFAALRTVRFARVRPMLRGDRAAALGLFRDVRRVIRERDGAAVHVFGSMPSYLTFAALAAGRAEGRVVVWTPMFHPLRGRVWRTRWAYSPMLLFDRLVPYLGRLATTVGAATEAEAAAFERAGCRRVVLLPPAVAAKPIAATAEALAFRRSLNLDGDPAVLVVASRDEPRKGLPFAFAAFEQVRERIPHAKLVLVGLSLEPSLTPAGVMSVGRVPDCMLSTAIRAANVVFVPSLFEAFSRIVIEAWEQARPAVVTDGVAMAPRVAAAGGEVVGFGDVAAATKALAAYLDTDWKRATGQRGRKFVEDEYAVAKVVDDAIATYSARPAVRRPPAVARVAG